MDSKFDWEMNQLIELDRMGVQILSREGREREREKKREKRARGVGEESVTDISLRTFKSNATEILFHPLQPSFDGLV